MLTRREWQVAELVAQGATRQDMALALAITVSAIDKQVHALKAKLGARSHAALVLRCAEHLAARAADEARRTEGPLLRHPPAPPGAEVGGAPDFDPAQGFDALFSRLAARLQVFGITHLSYSQIRLLGPGRIAHVASRWSLPPDVAFDQTLDPAENPTFAYAATSDRPLPLDLEAMQGDAAYQLLPERIRAQNARFVAAGLARGITCPLPGVGASDRLVLSALMQGAPAAAFAEVVARHTDQIRLIALDFRNAHVAKAQPRFRLTEREAALLDGLAEGRALTEVAAGQGLSRRAAERCLATLREALGLPNTTALVAAHLRNQSEPVLPF
jgi:DNA-binding NarL/FixJ family response regulator